MPFAGHAMLVLAIATVTIAEANAEALPSNCASQRYAIQIDHEIKWRRTTSTPTQWSPSGVGRSSIVHTIKGDVASTAPLVLESGQLRAKVTAEMRIEERIRWRMSSCHDSRAVTLVWTLIGTVSDQCSVDFRVERSWSAAGATRNCSSMLGGFAPGFSLHSPSGGSSWQMVMPLAVGASAKQELRDRQFEDTTTFTIVAAP